MDIGVPKEVKDKEFRVGLSPDSVRSLSDQGHRIVVEQQAGIGAGFTDNDYENAGAMLVANAKLAWDQEMVVKVKEPLPQEYPLIKSDQILFTYLHLAASRPLTERLIESGVAAIAYETVERPNQSVFPLLTPMSIIAGRLAVQFGAQYLERQNGGRGALLSGVPGVRPGRVTILGGGIVGTEAARIAIGMGARVQIFDINVERLSYLETLFGSQVDLLYSSTAQLESVVPNADLVIGAVLIPGRKPPVLVTRTIVEQMQPGSVIVDVAVDQGGCVETLRPTSHSNPTYVELDVVHYGVPNMPGAVPWTATQALNNSTFPYVMQLANKGLKALENDPGFALGVNIRDHKIIHPVIQDVYPDLTADH